MTIFDYQEVAYLLVSGLRATYVEPEAQLEQIRLLALQLETAACCRAADAVESAARGEEVLAAVASEDADKLHAIAVVVRQLVGR